MIVREVHSVKVAVLGAVRMPGHYEVNSSATVLDLIARAQGLTEFADRGPNRRAAPERQSDDAHPVQLPQGRRRARTGQLLRAARRHHRRSLKRPPCHVTCCRPPLTTRWRSASWRSVAAPRAAGSRGLRRRACRGDVVRAVSPGPVPVNGSGPGRAVDFRVGRADSRGRRARKPSVRHQAGNPQPRPADCADRAVQPVPGAAEAGRHGRGAHPGAQRHRGPAGRPGAGQRPDEDRLVHAQLHRRFA